MSPKLLSVLFIAGMLSACHKEAPTGPCEEVPKTFVMSLHTPPSKEQAQFFTTNYKACKKRKLKRDPNALFSVGVSVLHGLGTQSDPMKAFLWFKGAADKGQTDAQRILSQMFAEGVGVHQDPMIAKKYADAAQSASN